MEGYLELFDTPRYGRIYVVRLFAKFFAVIALNAAIYFLIGSGSLIKALGGMLLVLALGTGYWAFRPKYPCLKCVRPMHVGKKPKQGTGGKDLFLVCHDCKVCIDLNVGEE